MVDYPTIRVPIIQPGLNLNDLVLADRAPVTLPHSSRRSIQITSEPPSLDISFTDRADTHSYSYSGPPNHIYREFLHGDSLRPDQYVKLKQQLALNDHLALVLSQHAVAPAASAATTHYREKTWPRDAMMTVIALFRAGHHDLAVNVLWSWIELYGSHEHRGRFYDFVSTPGAADGFNDPNRAPVSAAEITAEGKISRKRIPWGHNQLESAAWVLGTAYRMANRGYLNLKTEVNDRLNLVDEIQGNRDNQKESLLVLMAKFFVAIKYWEQSDLGMWEYLLRHKRGSSIGIVLGALREVERFHDKHGWDYFPSCFDGDSASVNAKRFEATIRKGIDLGRTEYNKRVPDIRGATARECSEALGEFDSAILFTGYPFDLDLTRNQLFALIKVLEMNSRDRGVIRYSGDDYVASDFPSVQNSNVPHFFGDTNSGDFSEAEWTNFRPVGAAMLARYAIEHSDRATFLNAERLFKETLTGINTEPSRWVYDRATEGQHISFEVEVPTGALTEAFYYTWQGSNRILVPNHNYTLSWSAAMLALATDRMHEAATHFHS